MNQNEIEELEKTAKTGNADAQYMFGILNSLNGYYELAREYISDSAKQNYPKALDWISRHKKLTNLLASITANLLNGGLQIKVWNVKKGEQAEVFGINPLSDGAVLILTKKENAANSSINFTHYHSELIKEKYFHIMYDRWELYLNGVLQSKDIKPTKNSKYLISIIHYIIENNKDLKWC